MSGNFQPRWSEQKENHRSATLAIAFLMEHRNLNLKQAIRQVMIWWCSSLICLFGFRSNLPEMCHPTEVSWSNWFSLRWNLEGCDWQEGTYWLCTRGWRNQGPTLAFQEWCDTSHKNLALEIWCQTRKLCMWWYLECTCLMLTFSQAHRILCENWNTLAIAEIWLEGHSQMRS